MKISLSWLSEYVALPPSVEELAKRLTMAGLEVEGIERPGKALDGVVVAKIVASAPHPNADKLSVTQVDRGQGAPLQIVCGAKNFKVGDFVPLATVGTTLPNGVSIKQAALRGVDSSGMLCSAKELGLAEDAQGLLILEGAPTPGTPIAKHLGIDDTLFEINVTPNRADALSHLGIAREVSTLFGVPLKPPAAKLTESEAVASERIRIRIEDAARCPRYAARVIEGVTVGPSPSWLQQRLKACGVRAINNLVDVTNYVLLEYGQPLHAFDLDTLAGAEIVVRVAKPGEKLTTLDGKPRALDADDLLICDRDVAHVLAGVMGGAASEVTAKTTRVLLECAHFQPTTVRRSSKRHGLHTESSHRFERGTDVSVIPQVLDRAAALLAELGGGRVLRGQVDAYPKAIAPRRVTLRHARVGEILGAPVPAAESQQVLKSLGFVSVSSDATQTTFEVPMARVDVSIEEDLIEEVARIRGYDAIPMALPRGAAVLEVERDEAIVQRRLRVAMAGLGLTEVVNYSFVAMPELEAFGAGEGAIAISNPLSAEQSVMRTTLLPSLVQNVARAARHQATGVKFYELACSYRQAADGGKDGRPVADERLQLAGALWGLRGGSRRWTAKDEAVDFYDAKAAVEAVLNALHIEGATFAPLVALVPPAGECLGGRQGDVDRLGRGAASTCAQAARCTGWHRSVPARCRGASAVLGLGSQSRVDRQVSLGASRFGGGRARRHAERSGARRDLEVGRPLVSHASVFDVYTGAQVGAGRKNLAYALTYSAADRTLTDTEVSAAHQRIVAEVTQRLGGSLRT